MVPGLVPGSLAITDRGQIKATSEIGGELCPIPVGMLSKQEILEQLQHQAKQATAASGIEHAVFEDEVESGWLLITTEHIPAGYVERKARHTLQSLLGVLECASERRGDITP